MFEKIQSYLDENDVSYRSLTHEPTYTSEDSARVRGEELAIGGKALLLKIDQDFFLFVLSAARKLNSSALKKHFKAKKLRFANREELFDMTGLEPGAVPPFGRPMLDFDLYVDESVLANEKIAFNAGSLRHSVIMPTEDYLKIAHPTVLSFSK